MTDDLELTERASMDQSRDPWLWVKLILLAIIAVACSTP